MSKNQNTYQKAMEDLRPSEGFQERSLAAVKHAALKKKGTIYPRRSAYLGAALIACLVLALFGLSRLGVFLPGAGGRETTPAAPSGETVFIARLNINPGVEFRVDESGMILSVTGTNEDGAALIAGMDFTGLSFENATILVVNRLIEENYITASMVAEDILLSVSGGAGGEDLLTVMSSVIRSAASQYDLSVETREKEANQLELLLASKPEEPQEGELPAVKEEELPLSLQVEYDLTGRNAPYSEVNDVRLTLENGETYPSYQILTSYDLAGGSVNFTTFWCTYALMEKGYLSNDLAGQAVIRMPGATAEQLSGVERLISLMLEDGMLLLKAEIADAETIRICRGEALASEETGRYTLSQLVDIMYVKDREDISARQKEILKIAFSENDGEDFLRPRYFAVVPNFIGMTEEEAAALCERVGFVPSVVREPFTAESKPEEAGRVIFQDCSPGARGKWARSFS